jgi:hypothetical protein
VTGAVLFGLVAWLICDWTALVIIVTSRSKEEVAVVSLVSVKSRSCCGLLIVESAIDGAIEALLGVNDGAIDGVFEIIEDAFGIDWFNGIAAIDDGL